MTRRRAAAEAPITPTIIRSVEPIDVVDFLRRYARAIVEVKGAGPTAPTSTPTITAAATEAYP